MIDFIADYLETIRKRRVFPDVKPGYMRLLLPESAPINGEEWDQIFADIERVIMPGQLSLVDYRQLYYQAQWPKLKLACCCPTRSDPLAVTIHACLLPGSEQSGFASGRHVGQRHRITGIHLGETLPSLCCKKKLINESSDHLIDQNCSLGR